MIVLSRSTILAVETETSLVRLAVETETSLVRLFRAVETCEAVSMMHATTFLRVEATDCEAASRHLANNADGTKI